MGELHCFLQHVRTQSRVWMSLMYLVASLTMARVCYHCYLCEFFHRHLVYFPSTWQPNIKSMICCGFQKRCPNLGLPSYLSNETFPSTYSNCPNQGCPTPPVDQYSPNGQSPSVFQLLLRQSVFLLCANTLKASHSLSELYHSVCLIQSCQLLMKRHFYRCYWPTWWCSAYLGRCDRVKDFIGDMVRSVLS